MLNPITVTSNANGTNLVISEVLYDTPGLDSEEEWIEIYNPTSKSISLDNWYLYDNTAAIYLGGSIESMDHFVVARNSEGFYDLYGIYPDMSTDFALNNEGDYLFLYSPDGMNVDYVEWELNWKLSAYETTIHRRNSLDTDTSKDWENSHSLGDPGKGTYPDPDIDPPVIEFINPLNNTLVEGEITVQISVTDLNLNSYKFYINGTSKYGRVNATLFEYSWNTVSLDNGVYILFFEAYDDDQNYSNESILINVFNEIPETVDINTGVSSENSTTQESIQSSVSSYDRTSNTENTTFKFLFLVVPIMLFTTLKRKKR
jgi:hypothetical protein